MNIFVKENLKAIHQEDIVMLKNALGEAKITKHSLGTITLPTGHVSIGNPYNCSIKDLDRHTFNQSVQPGSYHFIVYESCHHKNVDIAFIEILFNNICPTHFAPAITIKDKQLNRKGPYGYMIHDNLIGFMDAETYRIISAASNPINLFHESIDETTIDTDIEYENFSIKNTTGNIITLAVPYGCHYWYYGKDQNGNLCSLIGDFYSFY